MTGPKISSCAIVILLSTFEKTVGWMNHPVGFSISDDEVAVDDYFNRNVQVPRTAEPSSDVNTVGQRTYGINFSGAPNLRL